MSVARYLYDIGCDQLKFRDKCTYRIIDTRLLQSGRLKRKRPVLKTSEELGDWIQDDNLLQPTIEDREPLEGGLRLLIHKGTSKYKSDRGISNAPMPFKNKDVLGKVLDKLGVCKSYPIDFLRRQYIPLRIDLIGKGDVQKLRIVCQSPNLTKDFATMTMCYDSKTRLTSGFLGYSPGHMSKMMDVLEGAKLDVYCSHPLLLPVLMYMVAVSMLRGQLQDVNNKINSVQYQTGLLDDFLVPRKAKPKRQAQGAANAPGETQTGSSQTKPPIHARPSTSHFRSSFRLSSPGPSAVPISGPAENNGQRVSVLGDSNPNLAHAKEEAEEAEEEKPSYDRVHRVLVEQHARLTSDFQDFVEDLGKGCRAGFDKIEASDIGKNILNRTTAHHELHSWVLKLELEANCEVRGRQRMLSRVDVQLKVLYNLMQQNIADETRRDGRTMRQIADETLRDSSAMKGIALVTMIFLPSTALATIFSMSPFFSATPNNKRLSVSPQFYVFWCVAIPLTMVVIATYTLWAQRAEVRAWYAERRRNKYQKQQKGPGSERERGRDVEMAQESDGVGKEKASSQEDRKQL